jgi:hypothetical protein
MYLSNKTEANVKERVGCDGSGEKANPFVEVPTDWLEIEEICVGDASKWCCHREVVLL